MCRSVFVRGSFLLLGTAIVLAIPDFAQTQEKQLAVKEDLKRAFDASYTPLAGLVSGEQTATKADKKHADAAAQWYLYRFTIQYYVTPTTTLKAPIDVLHREFHDKINDLTNENNVRKNAEYRKLFGASLVSSMKRVLESRDMKNDPSTIICVCEMLPDMARLKQDEVSAYLCELAKDGTNPAVQLYALKALKKTMPVALQTDPDDPAQNEATNIYNARKVRDVKNVDTLRQFIERPVNTAAMTPDEVKALIFVRREAIISLAQAGSPAVIATPNKKMQVQPQGAAAHTLLNVLAGNLQPPVTLPEKVEAALGLCAMKYPNMPEYEPQVAIYLIGKTLDEFVIDYQKDWVNFNAVAAGRKLPYLPYLGDAKRWQTGLKELSANTPNPAAKSAKALQEAAAPVLTAIIGTAKDKYQNPELRAVNDLRAVVAQTRPKTDKDAAYIFKTLKMPGIPLGK